jgi:hypothetical protein
MPKVISFLSHSTNKLRICLDAVDSLETASRRIRAVIERCSDGPTKSLLCAQQQLLQKSLDEAKMKIADVVADHPRKHPYA